MQQERDNNKGDCRCKLITQTVKAFLECLNLRHSSSSSNIAKSKARNVKTESFSRRVFTSSSCFCLCTGFCVAGGGKRSFIC